MTVAQRVVQIARFLLCPFEWKRKVGMYPIKSRNKKVAMGMVLMMLFASMAYDVIQALDASQIDLRSQAFPIGLPDTLGGYTLLRVAFVLALALTGLLMALLPASLSRTKSLLCGFALLSVGTLLSPFANSMLELVFWRIIFGVGWTLHFCAWLSIGAAFFPRHCLLVVAVMNSVVAVGGIVSRALINIILENAGWAAMWPGALAGVTILCLLGTFTAYLFDRCSAADKRHMIRSAPTGAALPWSAGPLLIVMATVCLILATEVILPSYSRYMHEVQGFPVKTVLLVQDFGLLSAFLSPLAGWLGVRYGGYKVSMIAAFLTGALGLALFLVRDISLSALLPLAFLASFGIQAVLYVNVLAVAMQSVMPLQSMRVLGLFSAGFYLSFLFGEHLFAYLQGMLGWRHAAILQIALPLLLFAILIWLAQKVMQRREREAHAS